MARSEHPDSMEGRLLLGAADWLTLLLLSAGTIFPCLSAYGVSGRVGFDFGAVLAFCAFGSLAVSVMYAWRRWFWGLLALLAAGGVIFWRLWEHMAEDWRRVRPPNLLDLLETSPGALFLLYALALLVLGWLVVRARAWWPAALLATLPLLPAIQSGVLPAWGGMLAAFAGWGSMLLTALFSRRDAASLGRARFLSLGGMAALVLILVMALPRESYTRPQWATDARNRMIRSVTRQLDRFFDLETMDNSLLADLGLDFTIIGEETGPGTGAGTGPGVIEIAGGRYRQREDLLAAGPRRYAERLVMTLRTDQPNPAGRLYLRGMSFETYTGVSWEGGQLPDAAGAERFPSLTAPDAPEYTMHIRNTAFRGVWYYPYRFTGGGEMDESGRITGLDAALTGGDLPSGDEFDALGTMEYAVTYRPGGPGDGFTPLDGGWSGAEENYRYGTVRLEEPYLFVPSGVRETLEPLLEEVARETVPVDADLPERYRETVAAAARTAGWLASAAAYDPNTPAMEAGEDFVTQFLEEGRGYCVHFATAGTLLLRLQGIPARYVTGYAADLDGRGRSVVMDSSAHAWVEIYLDGYGWYPVEMTPGYTGGPSGVELEGGAEAPSPEEEQPEEPDETPEEEQPDETPPEDGTPEGENPEDAPAGEDGAEERRVAAIWKWLFGLALCWAVLCAAYLTASLIRRRAREDKDTNRSVLDAYRRYRLLRRWGCGEDEELDRLAKKAKFSQYTLTEEERESAWKSLDEAVRQSRIGQPRRRRWALDLLSPLF